PASVPWSSDPTSSGCTAVAASTDHVGVIPRSHGSSVSHHTAQPSSPSSSPPAADTAGPDGHRPANAPSSTPTTAAYRANTAHPYPPWYARRPCEPISAPTASPDASPLPMPSATRTPPPGAVGPCSRSRMCHHRPPAVGRGPARPRPVRPRGPHEPPPENRLAPPPRHSPFRTDTPGGRFTPAHLRRRPTWPAAALMVGWWAGYWAMSTKRL